MDKKTALDTLTEAFITRYYPYTKQKSDDVDWKVHTTRLITYSEEKLTIDMISKEIYISAANILEKKSTLEEELNRLNSIYNLPESWEQLLKVGIRSGWVDLIKRIYYQILEDDSITDKDIYFEIQKRYPPLTEYLPEG